MAIKGVFLSFLLCPSVWSRSKYALPSYLLPKSQSDVSALTHFYHQFKLRKQARIHIYISWTIPAVWEGTSGKGAAQPMGGGKYFKPWEKTQLKLVFQCPTGSKAAEERLAQHAERTIQRFVTPFSTTGCLRDCLLPFWSETHNSAAENMALPCVVKQERNNKMWGRKKWGINFPYVKYYWCWFKGWEQYYGEPAFWITLVKIMRMETLGSWIGWFE